MSYCRWSSSNFECDLYCYEDVSGGWTTHVASSKRLGPTPIKRDGETPDEYANRLDALFVPIGLDFDGVTFNDPSLEDFKARLVMLRDAGYRFPDYVLANVDEEIRDDMARNSWFV